MPFISNIYVCDRCLDLYQRSDDKPVYENIWRNNGSHCYHSKDKQPYHGWYKE